MCRPYVANVRELIKDALQDLIPVGLPLVVFVVVFLLLESRYSKFCFHSCS
jgi:hypothetical protein